MPTFATKPPPPPVCEQLTTVLEHVRDSRHHSACRCGVYRRPDYRGYENAPFCSVEEFRFTVEIDRLLERIRRA